MKKQLKLYKPKNSRPLTDKQKIEILNTKVSSAEERAHRAEKNLESYKISLEIHKNDIRDSYDNGYKHGYHDSVVKNTSWWKFWK